MELFQIALYVTLHCFYQTLVLVFGDFYVFQIFQPYLIFAKFLAGCMRAENYGTKIDCDTYVFESVIGHKPQGQMNMAQ